MGILLFLDGATSYLSHDHGTVTGHVRGDRDLDELDHDTIYHVPDRPCRPESTNRIYRSLPSNLTIKQSSDNRDVSVIN